MENEKYVSSEPSDPVREHEKKHGVYVEHEVEGPDKLQESQMPLGPNPNPFKLGPLSGSGR